MPGRDLTSPVHVPENPTRPRGVVRDAGAHYGKGRRSPPAFPSPKAAVPRQGPACCQRVNSVQKERKSCHEQSELTSVRLTR